MVLWAILISITLISCAALFFTVKEKTVNPIATDNGDGQKTHHRRLLAEIDADLAAGRISEDDATAAKSELAREVLKVQREEVAESQVSPILVKWLIPIATAGVAVISLGLYLVLGNPELPANPLAQRQPTQIADINVQSAIAEVEARLQTHPEDLRGWTVIAPIYMRNERFAEAAKAFRRILELSPITSDNEVNLAEALMMSNEGIATSESIELLQSAAKRDPEHVRSRFYLAGEATQQQEYELAERLWKELLLLSNGGEAWVVTARQGLAVAQEGLGLVGDKAADAQELAKIGADDPQRELIDGMVSGLLARLIESGGTMEEWTRLVKSQLVLDQVSAAQDAYNMAKSAFPDESARLELDALAAQNGLK